MENVHGFLLYKNDFSSADDLNNVVMLVRHLIFSDKIKKKLCEEV